MRILYCNKYNFRFSGTEAYLFELMAMMRGAGHTTALFSMAGEETEGTEATKYSAPRVDFKAKAGWLERAKLGGHAIYSREVRRKLEELIEQFRPEVAHVRNFYHHLSPSIFWELRKRKVPVIYHLNDFKLLCPNYNFVANGERCERCNGGRYWEAVRTGCYTGGRPSAAVLAAEAYVHRWLGTYSKCVDVFLAPSEFVREKLAENGWDRARIEVLPHFQHIPEAPVARKPGHGVLYFGRLSPEKGLEGLLRAMADVPEVPLTIAGEGPQRNQLGQLSQQLGLQQVRFVGQLAGTALETAIAACRFTVFPSLAYETLGKSILESYAFGKAVVASDLGSRREFVRAGETGLLYDPKNPAELADRIRSLHQDPDRCTRMGQGALRFLRAKHSPEQHCQAICALYEKLARERASWNYFPAAPKPSLRVAFIGGRGLISKYSGIEAYYEEVGSRLAARGHEVTVYCRNYFTPPVLAHRGMRVVRLPAWRSKNWETLLHTALSTAHAIHAEHDVIHYHALGPALFAFLPRMFGIKTAVTVQGLDGHRKKWGRVAAAVLGLGERAAIWCADSTMVVSHELQRYYHQRYAAEPAYIANGATLRQSTATQNLREWGLTSEQYVLFLGRFSPEKNCRLLIEAFEDADPPVTLVLAGGADEHDPYFQDLRRHASEKVRFLNYVSGAALDELLTNAMLFVLPSDLEGLSLALLDAMGAGLCVLTSDIPENRELVEGVGFTFRPGDRADLEQMLRVLIASPSVRAEAGRKARERILASYDWEEITSEIETEYQRILGRKSIGLRNLEGQVREQETNSSSQSLVIRKKPPSSRRFAQAQGPEEHAKVV